MIVIMALFLGADEKRSLGMLEIRCVACQGCVMRPFQWGQPANLNNTTV
jgi:hypothetical protein